MYGVSVMGALCVLRRYVKGRVGSLRVGVWVVVESG